MRETKTKRKGGTITLICSRSTFRSFSIVSESARNGAAKRECELKQRSTGYKKNIAAAEEDRLNSFAIFASTPTTEKKRLCKSIPLFRAEQRSEPGLRARENIASSRSRESACLILSQNLRRTDLVCAENRPISQVPGSDLVLSEIVATPRDVLKSVSRNEIERIK